MGGKTILLVAAVAACGCGSDTPSFNTIAGGPDTGVGPAPEPFCGLDEEALDGPGCHGRRRSLGRVHGTGLAVEGDRSGFRPGSSSGGVRRRFRPDNGHEQLVIVAQPSNPSLCKDCESVSCLWEARSVCPSYSDELLFGYSCARAVGDPRLGTARQGLNECIQRGAQACEQEAARDGAECLVSFEACVLAALQRYDACEGETCDAIAEAGVARCNREVESCLGSVEASADECEQRVVATAAEFDRCEQAEFAEVVAKPPLGLDPYSATPDATVSVSQHANNRCGDSPAGPACNTVEIRFGWERNQLDGRPVNRLNPESRGDCWAAANDACQTCQHSVRGAVPFQAPIFPDHAPVVLEYGVEPGKPCTARAATNAWREGVAACARRPRLRNELGPDIRHQPGHWVPRSSGGEPRQLEALEPSADRVWWFIGDEADPPAPVSMIAFADCLASAWKRHLTWEFDADADGRCDGVECLGITLRAGSPDAPPAGPENQFVYSLVGGRPDPLSDHTPDAQYHLEIDVVLDGLPDGADATCYADPIGEVAAEWLGRAAGGGLVPAPGCVPYHSAAEGATVAPLRFTRLPQSADSFGTLGVEVCVPEMAELGCGECAHASYEAFWPLFGVQVGDTGMGPMFVPHTRENFAYAPKAWRDGRTYGSPRDRLPVAVPGVSSAARVPNWYYYWSQIPTPEVWGMYDIRTATEFYMDSRRNDSSGIYYSSGAFPFSQPNNIVFSYASAVDPFRDTLDGNGLPVATGGRFPGLVSNHAHEWSHVETWLANTNQRVARENANGALPPIREAGALVSFDDWSGPSHGEESLEFNHWFPLNPGGKDANWTRVDAARGGRRWTACDLNGNGRIDDEPVPLGAILYGCQGVLACPSGACDEGRVCVDGMCAESREQLLLRVPGGATSIYETALLDTDRDGIADWLDEFPDEESEEVEPDAVELQVLMSLREGGGWRGADWSFPGPNHHWRAR